AESSFGTCRYWKPRSPGYPRHFNVEGQFVGRALAQGVSPCGKVDETRIGKGPEWTLVAPCPVVVVDSRVSEGRSYGSSGSRVGRGGHGHHIRSEGLRSRNRVVEVRADRRGWVEGSRKLGEFPACRIVALRRSQRIPADGLLGVGFHAVAIAVEITQRGLRINMALFAQEPEPAQAFLPVLRNTNTVPVCVGDFILGIGIALIGGKREPAESLRIVALHAPSPPVISPEFKLRFGDAFLGEVLKNPEGSIVPTFGTQRDALLQALRQCRKRDRKRCRGGKHRHDDQHALPVPEHSEPSICICCGIDDTRRRYGPYPPEQGGARMPAQSDPYAPDGSIPSVPQEDPMKANPAILALVMSAMLGFPASAQIPATGEGIGGIYAGSYLCEDG